MPAVEAASGHAGFVVSCPLPVVSDSFSIRGIPGLAFVFRFRSFVYNPEPAFLILEEKPRPLPAQWGHVPRRLQGIAVEAGRFALCPALHYILKES